MSQHLKYAKTVNVLSLHNHGLNLIAISTLYTLYIFVWEEIFFTSTYAVNFMSEIDTCFVPTQGKINFFLFIYFCKVTSNSINYL